MFTYIIEILTFVPVSVITQKVQTGVIHLRKQV